MKFLKQICLAASLLFIVNVATAAVNFADGGIVENVSAGSFSHSGTFVIDPAGDYSTGVVSLGFRDTIITGLQAVITQGQSIWTILDGNDIVIPFNTGTYEYTISGVSDGEGFYALSVSPVPEASTIALMLSGLGVVGFMTRRRNK